MEEEAFEELQCANSEFPKFGALVIARPKDQGIKGNENGGEAKGAADQKKTQFKVGCPRNLFWNTEAPKRFRNRIFEFSLPFSLKLSFDSQTIYSNIVEIQNFH